MKAEKFTISQQGARLELSLAEAQELLTLLLEVTRPDKDWFGALLLAYGHDFVRSAKRTSHELVRELQRVAIPASKQSVKSAPPGFYTRSGIGRYS